MRILLLGARGMIGSVVRARLQGAGHDVRAVGRRARSGHDERRVDIARVHGPDEWLPHLEGVDAVINCAGILQDAPGESTTGVHARGVEALFRACEIANVRRVVHLSAIGVDREQPTGFSRSKLEGEEALRARDLEWVILRPAVVVGPAAYGGSALFRGLAALPLLPRVPDAKPLQIVQLDDLVATILHFLAPDVRTRVAIDVAGPERLTMEEVVAAYRAWLGYPPARLVPLPAAAWRAIYKVGDFIGWLGWRPPVRSTAQIEMRRGAVGDIALWTQLTGLEPQSLRSALAHAPVSVQERWFAHLYLLKALVLAVFAAFWIVTGLLSLGPGWDIGMELLTTGGLGLPLAAAAIIAGALADIVIGIGIALRRTARVALWAALSLSVIYTVLGTALVPSLWEDPLGPMLKIWPVMALNLVALAVLDDR